MSSSRPEKRRNELLIDVEHHAASILIKRGMPKEAADEIGEEIADHLATNWGGQMITFPKDIYYRVAKKHAAVVAEFTGTNHDELARKYGLSVRAIYKIIKDARDAKKATTGENHVSN